MHLDAASFQNILQTGGAMAAKRRRRQINLIKDSFVESEESMF
jgi:hypothetical protein